MYPKLGDAVEVYHEMFTVTRATPCKHTTIGLSIEGHPERDRPIDLRMLAWNVERNCWTIQDDCT